MYVRACMHLCVYVYMCVDSRREKEQCNNRERKKGVREGKKEKRRKKKDRKKEREGKRKKGERR